MKDTNEKDDVEWLPPATITDLYQTVGANRFSGINRPTAGSRFEGSLEEGKEDFQFYSLATPNGQKVGILLEELFCDPDVEFKYDAHTISIMKGEQFSSGYVGVNPNSKIPCATDVNNGKKVRLFESGSILFYLAKKYGKFFPTDLETQTECMNWLMFAQIQAFVSGNYGHFFVYAPSTEVGARNYGVNRYGMDLQRMCSVLDQHLEHKTYICGTQYTIADMALLPWYEAIRTTGYMFESGSTVVATKDFLNLDQYRYLNRWADLLCARKAVQRGLLVCRKTDYPKAWLNLKDKRFENLRMKSEIRLLNAKL